MNQAELDSQMEAKILAEYLGALAMPFPPNKADGITLPVSVAGTSVVLFIAQYIAEGLLLEQGTRVLHDLFGGTTKPDLEKLMKEVFTSLLPRLRNAPQASNVDQNIGATLDALEVLQPLLAEHLTNPPPQGPSERIREANTKARTMEIALANLSVLGFHNYLLVNGVFLLVFAELSQIDGQGEMKNACRQLRDGLAKAEKALREWRAWSDSRFGFSGAGWVGGEPTVELITLDGNRYTADGVRGWYSLNDPEDQARLHEELKRAKNLVWDDVRRQYFLDQAIGVLQKWQELKAHWSGLGYCA